MVPSTELLVAHQNQLINGTALFVKTPSSAFRAIISSLDPYLVHIKVTALVQLGDWGSRQNVQRGLAQRAVGTLGAEAIARYQRMADTMVEKRDYYRHSILCAVLLALRSRTPPMQRPTSLSFTG